MSDVYRSACPLSLDAGKLRLAAEIANERQGRYGAPIELDRKQLAAVRRPRVEHVRSQSTVGGEFRPWRLDIPRKVRCAIRGQRHDAIASSFAQHDVAVTRARKPAAIG